MEFDWGPAKATANLKKHRGSFHEAATVLQDPLSTSFPDEMHAEEEAAPVERRGASERSMNKANRPEDDELRPEYDFASMTGGVRGKYVVGRARSATPDVLGSVDAIPAPRG